MQKWMKKKEGEFPRVGTTVVVCNGRTFEIINGVEASYFHRHCPKAGQHIAWWEVTHWRYLDYPKDFPMLKE